VLIADAGPSDVEAAISVVSITELHFGMLKASSRRQPLSVAASPVGANVATGDAGAVGLLFPVGIRAKSLASRHGYRHRVRPWRRRRAGRYSDWHAPRARRTRHLA
jgi:hypothetical protein